MIRIIIFMCLVAVVFLFALQNMQTIEVRLFIWNITVSRALILLITLAIGLIGGSLLTYPSRRRKWIFKR